jgi:hypothetical protein
MPSELRLLAQPRFLTQPRLVLRRYEATAASSMYQGFMYHRRA